MEKKMKDKGLRKYLKETVPAFLAAHSEYVDSPLFDALDMAVRRLQAKDPNRQFDPSMLEEAHVMVRDKTLKALSIDPEAVGTKVARCTIEADDYPTLLLSLALEWEADISFNRMVDGSETGPSAKIRPRELCDRQTLQRRIQLLRDVAEHLESVRAPAPSEGAPIAWAIKLEQLGFDEYTVFKNKDHAEAFSRMSGKPLLPLYAALAPVPAREAVEMKPLELDITKEWFEKRSALEGDFEIGAGRRTSTINLMPEEIAELEKLALSALPQWAKDEILFYRAIARTTEAEG